MWPRRRTPPVVQRPPLTPREELDLLAADVIAAHNAAYHPGRNCRIDDLDYYCVDRQAALAAEDRPNQEDPDA